jgi:hypothetical protein
LVGDIPGCLGVVLEGEGEHIPRFGVGRQERLGDVEGVAVVGQKDGDLLAFAFESVKGQGQTDSHAIGSFGPNGLI